MAKVCIDEETIGLLQNLLLGKPYWAPEYTGDNEDKSEPQAETPVVTYIFPPESEEIDWEDSCLRCGKPMEDLPTRVIVRGFVEGMGLPQDLVILCSIDCLQEFARDGRLAINEIGDDE